MAIVGRNIRLVVVGTRKSQILDVDEEFVLEFTKDEELRDDFSDANELINSFVETSLYRGDMIRSLVVDGRDLVRTAVSETLVKFSMNANEAFSDVFALPFFCNADPADVFEMVTLILSSMELGTEGEDHDEY